MENKNKIRSEREKSNRPKANIGFYTVLAQVFNSIYNFIFNRKFGYFILFASLIIQTYNVWKTHKLTSQFDNSISKLRFSKSQVQLQIQQLDSLNYLINDFDIFHNKK